MAEIVNFVKLNYFLVGYGITLLISLVKYHKYYNTVLKYFPILIAYTFLNELLGTLIRYTDIFTLYSKSELTNANDVLYNIFDFFFFGFFYYVYWKLSKSNKARKLIVFGSAIAFLAYIFNAVFGDPLTLNLYYANGVACWVLAIFAIQHISHLRPNLKWKIQRYNLMFWISTGLVIFHFCFPFPFITGYINYTFWLENNLIAFIRILIVIMYTFFSIGFIVSRKKSFN